MSGNAVQILDVLIQYLVVEHIDYAVELGLQGMVAFEIFMYVIYFPSAMAMSFRVYCNHPTLY